MVETPVRLLLVEDDPNDARLVQYELKRAGYVAETVRVETEADFKRELAASPDLVLCDWNLPQFSAPRALEILQAQAANIPFIVVSGSIGEEAAVQAINDGATDYLLKDRLSRLGSAIKRALALRDLRAAERRARDELTASEQRYRDLVEMALDSIAIVQGGQVVYLNPAGKELMRTTSPESLLGPLLWDPEAPGGAPPSSGSSVFPRIKRFRVDYPDGSWVVMESCAGPCQYNGEPAVQVIARDITARVRDEEALRASEARFRAVVEQASDAIFLLEDDARVVDANRRAWESLGYTREELIGMQAGQFDAEFSRESQRRLSRQLDAGRPVTLDAQHRRKDGTTFPVEIRLGIVEMDERRLVLAMVRDVSARRWAEASLAAIMRSVVDGIITIDEVGTIGSANPAAVRLFGYEEAELLGRNVKLLMPEPYRSEHDGYLESFARTRVPKIIGFGREVPCLRKDGTVFQADLEVTEFVLDGVRRFTGVVRDISERRRLEEQLRQAQKMEAVGRLAGGVAHDFNNILTVINSYSELLLMDLPSDSPAREDLATILDAGQRGARLTSQLLAFSRRALVEPRELDLNEVVSRSDKLLQRLIGEDIALTCVLAPALGRIKADPSQLDQVLMNLAVNARDAMPTGGRLELKTRAVVVEERSEPGIPPGAYAELLVRDTGCGMTEDQLSNIFEPFFTTKPTGKGTGLGLSVVHGVVKQAGGYIRVASKPGAGTEFRILLPVVLDPPQAAFHAAEPRSGRGTETLLLVEDDAAVRRIARVSLENQGYRVLEAASGAEALRVLSEFGGSVDLLVTDVVMPEMNGRELADALRATLPELRVLYMSGYTDDEVVRRGIKEATDAFLHKPFTPYSLANKVWSVLRES